MKVTQTNVNAYKQSKKDKSELFSYDEKDANEFEDVTALDKDTFIAKHPAATLATTAALIGAPIVGLGATSMTSSAATLPDGAVDATFAGAQASLVQMSEDTQDMEKEVKISVSGPGHIEEVSNCTYDADRGVISFTDADATASFKVVGDTGTTKSEVKLGSTVIPTTDGVVTLEAHTSYVNSLSVSFAEDPAVIAAQEKAAQEKAAAEAAAAQAQAEAQAAAQQAQAESYVAPAANDYVAPAPAAPATPAPAPQKAATPAPAPARAATPAKASTPAPFSGAARHSMTDAEMKASKSIFEAYNNYRASKGLAKVAWSDDCANMAYGSVTGNAASGTGHLVHDLGIPGGVINDYADILQFTGWHASGQEVVDGWITSTGHRKMMQCDSATVAGVASYNNHGVWYFAIVYNFGANNQSGS